MRILQHHTAHPILLEAWVAVETKDNFLHLAIRQSNPQVLVKIPQAFLGVPAIIQPLLYIHHFLEVLLGSLNRVDMRSGWETFHLELTLSRSKTTFPLKISKVFSSSRKVIAHSLITGLRPPVVPPWPNFMTLDFKVSDLFAASAEIHRRVHLPLRVNNLHPPSQIILLLSH